MEGELLFDIGFVKMSPLHNVSVIKSNQTKGYICGLKKVFHSEILDNRILYCRQG